MTSDTPEKNVGSSGTEHGRSGGDGTLEVPRQPAASIEPYKGPFDHPIYGMDDAAALIGEFPDDLYRDGGSVPGEIAVVGAVGIRIAP